MTSRGGGFSKAPVRAAAFNTELAVKPAEPTTLDRPRSRSEARSNVVRAQTPTKTLGEVSDLGRSYTHVPARVNLTKAIQMGKLRNPMENASHQPMWSASARTELESTRPTLAASGGTRATSATADGRARAATAAAANQTYPALQPQRIELPAYLNTPARRPDNAPVTPEEKNTSIKRIRDLEMLTFACRRANKIREEGRAYFSLGVLQDNIGNYEKAIKSYANFLKVCKECNDTQGCALAYHCLGVDHQIKGTNDGKPDMLRKSLYFHNKHRESSDSVGKFVAHLNMGIAYSELGEKEAATVNHQYALRYALQLHSLEGQSLAIGNLGFATGMYDNDPDKMRLLIERYVELSDTLKHHHTQAGAFQKLGTLASQQGKFDESRSFFQQAIDAAKQQGNKEAEKTSRVNYGIAAGQARMKEHLAEILERSMKGITA
mmetsp:Transcript_5041/g.12397  ORF Transcript_5041/g.12397 Transcript_5041/m.12397 type:complete len:435 (-) Transcript_5041:86-1390(-)